MKGKLTSITSIHVQHISSKTTKSHDLGFHLYFCHLNPRDFLDIFEKSSMFFHHSTSSLLRSPTSTSAVDIVRVAGVIPSNQHGGRWKSRSVWRPMAFRATMVDQRHWMFRKKTKKHREPIRNTACMEYWPKLMVNVGKYYLHGAYGNDNFSSLFEKRTNSLQNINFWEGFMLVFLWE